MEGISDGEQMREYFEEFSNPSVQQEKELTTTIEREGHR